MATKTTATTLKLSKLVTNEEKRNRMPVGREQALDLGRLRDDLEVLVHVVLGRDHDLGHDGPADLLLLDDDGRRLDDLVGDLTPMAASTADSTITRAHRPEEDDGRVGHLVARPPRCRRACAASPAWRGPLGAGPAPSITSATVGPRRVARRRTPGVRCGRKSSASCRSRRAPKPVQPAVCHPTSPGDCAVPAMSTWAQGTSPTNSARNRAAVIAPALAPPRFLRSATVESSSLR